MQLPIAACALYMARSSPDCDVWSPHLTEYRLAFIVQTRQVLTST